jgi:hypothetical protein
MLTRLSLVSPPRRKEPSIKLLAKGRAKRRAVIGSNPAAPSRVVRARSSNNAPAVVSTAPRLWRSES